MDELIKIIIGQSPVIASLIFFIYFLIKDKKQSQAENDKKDAQIDNEKNAFREYLIRTNAEHHEIIKKNTEIFQELLNYLKQSDKKEK